MGLRERIEIEILHAAGGSMRSIGRQLGRSAATISRELRRNGRPTRQWPGGYGGARAQELARRRRWDARFKLARQPDLCALVRQGLAMGQSPEQIAGRPALQHGRPVISHESIYRFFYHRSSGFWGIMIEIASSERDSCYAKVKIDNIEEY